MGSSALTPRVKDLEDDYKDHDRRINLLAQWRDGNGADGAERRIQRLEDNQREGTCSVGKVINAHIQEHRDMKEERNETESWKVPLIFFGILQFLTLIIAVVGLLIG